jgi:hypothetical protein
MDSRTTIELLVREPNTSLGRRVYWIVNRICATQLFQLTRFFETSRLTFRDNQGALSFADLRNRSKLRFFVAYPALPRVELKSTA